MNQCKMGNCVGMNASFNQPERVTVLGSRGRVKKYKASTPIKKIVSGPHLGYELVRHSQPYLPLESDTKLEPGEVYYLIPPKVVHPDNCKKRTIKIVIARQQLELLLTNPRNLLPVNSAVQFSESPIGNKKWRPSLAAIPEANSF